MPPFFRCLRCFYFLYWVEGESKSLHFCSLLLCFSLVATCFNKPEGESTPLNLFNNVLTANQPLESSIFLVKSSGDIYTDKYGSMQRGITFRHYQTAESTGHPSLRFRSDRNLYER